MMSAPVIYEGLLLGPCESPGIAESDDQVLARRWSRWLDEHPEWGEGIDWGVGDPPRFQPAPLRAPGEGSEGKLRLIHLREGSYKSPDGSTELRFTPSVAVGPFESGAKLWCRITNAEHGLDVAHVRRIDHHAETVGQDVCSALLECARQRCTGIEADFAIRVGCLTSNDPLLKRLFERLAREHVRGARRIDSLMRSEARGISSLERLLEWLEAKEAHTYWWLRRDAEDRIVPHCTRVWERAVETWALRYEPGAGDVARAAQTADDLVWDLTARLTPLPRGGEPIYPARVSDPPGPQLQSVVRGDAKRGRVAAEYWVASLFRRDKRSVRPPMREAARRPISGGLVQFIEEA